MKVEVISCMYNEEFLIPFFLNHYSWVDTITVLLDIDTDDNSTEILEQNSIVNIIPFVFPNGMDDGLKSKLISDLYVKSDANWVIIADADEFIFINKQLLSCIPDEFTVVDVKLYDIYRHVTDSDLNQFIPISKQRQHGQLDPNYIKPSIARGKLNFVWGPGHHNIAGAVNRHQSPFIGSHWAMADPCFCISRRVNNRRDRQSKANKICGWSTQNWNITESSVLEECKSHMNDPLINDIERIVNHEV